MIKFAIVTIIYLWYVDITLDILDYLNIKNDTVVLNYYFKEITRWL